MADFSFQHHGTIVILTPTSPAGKAWVAENLPEDVQRWGQCSIAVEPRCAPAIVEGFMADGLDLS